MQCYARHLCCSFQSPFNAAWPSTSLFRLNAIMPGLTHSLTGNNIATSSDVSITLPPKRHSSILIPILIRRILRRRLGQRLRPRILRPIDMRESILIVPRTCPHCSIHLAQLRGIPQLDRAWSPPVVGEASRAVWEQRAYARWFARVVCPGGVTGLR